MLDVDGAGRETCFRLVVGYAASDGLDDIVPLLRIR